MTLNYLVDYLREFHATKEVCTAYRTSKATDSIAPAHMKELEMPLMAEHAVEDEEKAQCREALFHPQRETFK